MITIVIIKLHARFGETAGEIRPLHLYGCRVLATSRSIWFHRAGETGFFPTPQLTDVYHTQYVNVRVIFVYWYTWGGM